MNILLVGREGNGKSCTLRTINSADLNLTAKVCFGVGDGKEDLKNPLRQVLEDVQHEIQKLKYEGDIQAIVLVLKYGVRYTKQERDAVDRIRNIFGMEALMKFGVIVFTYGDLFEDDNSASGYTFMKWCKEQTGNIRLLFEEVNYRCVLMDNKTRQTKKQLEQVRQLHEVVSTLNGRYKMADYIAAEGTRKIIYEEFQEKNKNFVFCIVFFIVCLFCILFYSISGF